MNKKPSNKGYAKWLRDNHSVIINPGEKKYYESVSKKIRFDFEQSSFWKEFIENFNVYEMEYNSETDGYDLGIINFKPELLIKDFDSVLLKSYRKNIKYNKKWPDSPENGWILPDKFYSKINDIIRTTLIVRYLDGIDFMISKIGELSDVYGIKFKKYHVARTEGYYAVHIYITDEYEVPERMGYKTNTIEVEIEIQITTQLKDVIRKILFDYYKDRRINIKELNMDWAWDYEGEEFSANYLGHILHYLEGMIMDLRKR